MSAKKDPMISLTESDSYYSIERANWNLSALNWMPNDSLPFFRSNLSGIGKINLMMKASVREIVLIAVFFNISVNYVHRCGLVVKRSVMHYLNAQPFLNRYKLSFGAIKFFLLAMSQQTVDK